MFCAVSRQASKVNPAAALPLQFYMRSLFFPFFNTEFEQPSKKYLSGNDNGINVPFMIPLVCAA